jgi:hypothetical protein
MLFGRNVLWEWLARLLVLALLLAAPSVASAQGAVRCFAGGAGRVCYRAPQGLRSMGRGNVSGRAPRVAVGKRGSKARRSRGVGRRR